jgi:hypothetical protein
LLAGAASNPAASPWIPVSLGLFGIAILVSSAFAMSARRGETETEKLLLAADRAYAGHECLYTYYTRPADASSSFEPVLSRRARQLAARVDPAVVVPFPDPKRLVPPLAAVAVLALVLGLGALLSSRGEAQAAPDASNRLRELGEQLAAQAELSGNERAAELARELEALGQELASGDAEESETRSRVNRLGERIEEEARRLDRRRLLGTTEEELGAEPDEELAARLRDSLSEAEMQEFVSRFGAGGELSPDELGELRERLDDEEGGGASDRPSDEELEAATREAAEQRAAEATREALEEAREQIGEIGEGLAELEEGEGEAAGQSDLERSPRVTEADPPEPGESSESSESEPGGDPSSGGTSPARDGAEDDFVRLAATETAMSALPSRVSGEDSLSIATRELPPEASAGLGRQELLAVFERQVEEAISGRDVPIDLRSSVRQYFLSISAPVEEAANER